MGAPTKRRCAECGTEHANTRPDCEPLEKRRGPDVTSPEHPSNNGAWRMTLDAIVHHGLPA